MKQGKKKENNGIVKKKRNRCVKSYEFAPLFGKNEMKRIPENRPNRRHLIYPNPHHPHVLRNLSNPISLPKLNPLIRPPRFLIRPL